MKQSKPVVDIPVLDYEAIGVRIRTIRGFQQLKQQELAYMADINPGYLSKVERGEKHPSLDVIYRIAYVLQVGVDDLLHEQPLGNLSEAQRQIHKYVINSDKLAWTGTATWRKFQRNISKK